MMTLHVFGMAIDVAHLTTGFWLALLCAAWVHEQHWRRRLEREYRSHARPGKHRKKRLRLCRFHKERLFAIGIATIRVESVGQRRCVLCP